MTTTSRYTPLALIILGLIAALGTWLWTLRPEDAWVWAIAIFIFPLLWGGLVLRWRAKGLADHDPQRRQQLSRAMVGGGLIILVSLGAALASALQLFGTTGAKLPERSFGIIMGAIVVVMANMIPKTTRTDCESPVRRFVGWVMVLAGLGYALAWLLVPLEHARTVAIAVMGTGLALALGRVAWLKLARRQEGA